MKILSERPIFSMSLLLLLLPLLLLQVSNTSAIDQTTNSNQTLTSNQTDVDYITTSCNATLYQSLCRYCLYPYASLIASNPETLAVTALNLSLWEAKSARKFIKFIYRHHQESLTPRESADLKDCLEEMSECIYLLKDSINEMKEVNYSSFELIMSDVQTWVSAALTYQHTCMDGFQESGGVRTEVKDLVLKRVDRVARLTSNALALINLYASTHGN